jgi:hypothetical protein
MRRHSVCLLTAVLLPPSIVLGQLPATTVQLPTVSQFTVQTTVSVPDGGTMNLGSISRGAEGSLTRGFGPLRNRALGGSRTASGVSISARIIDHAEIDRAILAAAAAKRTAAHPATATAKTLSLAIGHSPAPTSVAAIRAAAAAESDRESRELTDLFTKAQAAEKANQPGVAKVYYQMVARRATGDLKDQATRRLAALTTPKAVQRLK